MPALQHGRTILQRGEQWHLDFNGTDERIEVPGFVPFTGSGSAYTFMGWFKLFGNQSWEVISGWGSASGNGTRVTFRLNNSKPRIEVGGNGETGSQQAADGTWHHWAWTYNGNGNLSGFKLYIDGSLDTDVTSTQGLVVDSTYPLHIMHGEPFSNLGVNSHTEGEADQIAMFSRELSQSELAWMKDEWLTGREPDLEMYFALMEGSGSTTKDLSNNGRQGDLKNGPTWQEG